LMSSRHVMIDGWVIDKNKSREFVHGRLMVDDFSAKEFHKFVARMKSFLHFCR